MIEFKDISNLPLDELFKELGIADFTYIETSNFLEQLENYRQKIHEQIKRVQLKIATTHTEKNDATSTS